MKCNHSYLSHTSRAVLVGEFITLNLQTRKQKKKTNTKNLSYQMKQKGKKSIKPMFGRSKEMKQWKLKKET